MVFPLVMFVLRTSYKAYRIFFGKLEIGASIAIKAGSCALLKKDAPGLRSAHDASAAAASKLQTLAVHADEPKLGIDLFGVWKGREPAVAQLIPQLGFQFLFENRPTHHVSGESAGHHNIALLSNTQVQCLMFT